MSTRIERRLRAKHLERTNRDWPEHLEQLPREKWEEAERNSPHSRPRLEVWRSRDFLVQVFEEENGMQRMSVVRTRFIVKTGRFDDGISWDDLQRCKREIGRGDVYAIEIYPRDVDIATVANMRHRILSTLDGSSHDHARALRPRCAL
jgi:hypothetical protein